MRYIGIDYGAKRIGIAVSDAGGTIAFPRETLTNMRGVIGAIQKIIEEEKIDFVVVGDTKSYGGIPNPVTLQVKDFVDDLKKVLNIPIASSWEVGSTMEANRYDPSGEHNDAAAAAVILQRYLDIKTGSVD